jgi:capsular polysaccharide biosynthesis protein
LYFSDALRVIARRWWIILIGLIAVTAGSGYVFTTVPTQYQATGQVLLLPPVVPVREGEGRNPYLDLPDGLTLTASLIAGTVSSKDTARQLEGEGFSSPYVVSVLPGTGPLIVISVKDADPDAALRLRNRLLELVEERVRDEQVDEDVSPTQLIKSRPFSVLSQAEVLAGARLRAVVLVGGVGGVVTLFAAFSFDRFRSRRTAAQARPEEPAQTEPALAAVPAVEPSVPDEPLVHDAEVGPAGGRTPEDVGLTEASTPDDESGPPKGPAPDDEHRPSSEPAAAEHESAPSNEPDADLVVREEVVSPVSNHSGRRIMTRIRPPRPPAPATPPDRPVGSNGGRAAP